jgi:hypothetical protein
MPMMRQSTTLTECLLRFAHVFGVQSAYTALANSQGKSRSGWRAGC